MAMRSVLDRRTGPRIWRFAYATQGKRDGASYLFGDQSNSDSAGLVHMIDKDDVELVRWTHGTSEQLEIKNKKKIGIVFQVAIRRSTSRNVRSSGLLPAWAFVPAGTTQPLVTLEQADRSKESLWNFDWRWDGWGDGKVLPRLPNLSDGGNFKTNAITFQYTNGVSLTKYIDVYSPNENALLPGVNQRKKTIAVKVTVDFPSEWQKFIEMPTETVVKRRVLPGKEVAIISIIAKPQYDSKVARSALSKIGFKGRMEDLKKKGAK